MGDERRQDGDADAGDRRLAYGIPVVERQPHLGLHALAVAEHPVGVRGDVRVGDTLVGLEIRRRRRASSRGKVSGTGDHDMADDRNPLRDQHGIPQHADAHGEVEPFADDIHDAVVHRDVDVKTRMPLHERADDRREAMDGQ